MRTWGRDDTLRTDGREGALPLHHLALVRDRRVVAVRPQGLRRAARTRDRHPAHLRRRDRLARVAGEGRIAVEGAGADPAPRRGSAGDGRRGEGGAVGRREVVGPWSAALAGALAILAPRMRRIFVAGVSVVALLVGATPSPAAAAAAKKPRLTIASLASHHGARIGPRERFGITGVVRNNWRRTSPALIGASLRSAGKTRFTIGAASL